jgi:hypothetical protein
MNTKALSRIENNKSVMGDYDYGSQMVKTTLSESQTVYFFDKAYLDIPNRL